MQYVGISWRKAITALLAIQLLILPVLEQAGQPYFVRAEEAPTSAATATAATATTTNSAKVSWQTIEESQYPVSPGVVHTSRTLTGNGLKESVHLLEIDPSNPYVKVEAVSSHGEVSELGTVNEMLRQLESKGGRPVAGTNGDFFSSLGVPSGLMISNGELVSSPSTSKVAMAIMKDHTVKIEDNVTMTSKLTKDNGESLTLTMINRTRVATHTNHAFLYNWRFGSSTRTPQGGVEVVVRADDPAYKLIPGQPVSATVVTVAESADTAIEPGTFVLSATGSKADWIRQKLSAGTRLRLDIAFSKGFGDAEQVISGNSTLGYVLIRNGEVSPTVLDPADPNTSDRHPRTMVASKQGKLYILTVDGRQPGHSDGITMAEGAYYLQSLGMENAINIDGGGSTTYYVRQPGDEHPSLLNRPSDGHDREVGNGIAVLSTAPVTALSRLVVSPDSPVQVAAGSRLSFELKGQDEYFNGVPVKPEEVQWSAQGSIGAFDGPGAFTASMSPASGILTVQSGNAVKLIDITVVDRADRLTLSPNPAVIEPGAAVRFTAAAADSQGRPIWISPDRIGWSAEGAIGSIDANGTLQSVNGTADGKVTASYNGVKAEAFVQVGKPPLLLEPFEGTGNMQTKESNAVAGSVTITAVARPNPVRYGTKAVKLTYDFTGKSGSSNAYVNLLNDAGEIGREVEGKPYRIGMWVYGDSNRHWLRLGVTDGMGTSRVFNFTQPGGLDWTGWKYVTADVPENTIFPLKVRYVLVNETDETNKNSGAVYLDNLRAEYMDLGEDVTGPVFGVSTPAPDSEVQGLRPEIAIGITDAGTGVDPGSIHFTVDGVAVDHQYDEALGTIRAVLRNDLTEGEHVVRVDAADRAGTYAIPSAGWSFRVKAPDTEPPRWGDGAGLTVTDITYHSVKLSWREAADNAAVHGYRIFQDGVSVASVTSSVYTATVDSLAANTRYAFEIEAFDPSGNTVRSGAITVTTAGDPVPPASPSQIRVSGHGHEIQASFTPPTDNDYAGTRIVILRNGKEGGKEGEADSQFLPPGIREMKSTWLKHGKYEVSIWAEDTSGNRSAPAVFEVKLNEGNGEEETSAL
ncbi:hypothetical protein DVH26_16510 [Paenibacillus sp. H1-7]|uniref:phosphodiester glycosidase family protein n=1 Tax=Paenibacillus sp. H1-7 TaxID=2282849 RepID=UPI001EF8F2C8|nr:phosphodiester glycosidase family protein [Paenibacillus sp. H1-7]ULL15904.1 hypothetical protein DVH26_16510 [Paenibacillus sp. H1-7]